MDPIEKKLWEAAKKARENSYSPYSNYRVGAAILCGKRIYSGTNVENSSYGATICAERSAVAQAISEGEKSIDAVLVVTEKPASPCGICRQVLSEFCQDDTPVWLSSGSEIADLYRFDELHPRGFKPSDLS